MTDPYKFDATPSITTVKTLKQFYLFIPAQVKTCYLFHLLKLKGPYAHRFDAEGKLREDGGSESDSDDDDYENGGSQKTKTSAIIFTSTCKACQELTETLLEVGEAICIGFTTSYTIHSYTIHTIHHTPYTHAPYIFIIRIISAGHALRRAALDDDSTPAYRSARQVQVVPSESAGLYGRGQSRLGYPYRGAGGKLRTAPYVRRLYS
jgi:hypothetical protein